MRATKAIAIALTLIVLGAAMPALAQSSRLYFATYLGLNITHNRDFTDSATDTSGSADFGNTPSFAGALGLRLNDNIRVEGEISYSDPNISHVNFSSGSTATSGGHLKTWIALLNAYYDFDFKWHNIQPFVSAGIGVANHTGNVSGLTNASGSSTGFAYQAGAGLKYRLNPDLAFTGGYRFVGTSDANIGDAKIKYNAQEVRIGLEYDLPVNWLK